MQAGGKGCVWQLWVSMATIFPPFLKNAQQPHWLLEPPVRAGGQIRVVQTGQAPGAGGGEAGELGHWVLADPASTGARFWAVHPCSLLLCLVFSADHDRVLSWGSCGRHHAG